MKRLIVLVTVISFFALTVNSVNAETVQTCTQVTQYGGAVSVVCGVHTPVEAGLADINPLYLASSFLSLAGYGMYSYKKLLRREVAL